MVLMHRKEIIERYGFDPGEDTNQSIVPKNKPGEDSRTAAITPVPDDKELEPPHQETESADAVPNMAAGIVKSWTTDPLMLYGFGTAAFSWAKRNALGEKDTDFATGLYKEGGVKAVQDHVNDYQKRILQEHPNWDASAVREEVERYLSTPEFFEFNSSQMSPAMEKAMKGAYEINKATGVDKTPFQESFIDDTLQTLGGALQPTGFLKIGKAAEQVAKRVGLGATGQAVSKAAGNVADWTVVPGTSTFTPGQVAGNVGVGAAVDEAIRHATGDPTVLGGDALLELTKNVQKAPTLDGPPPELILPELSNASPEDIQSFAQLSPEEKEAVRQNVRESGIGIGAAIAAVVAYSLGRSRGAFRGRVQPEPIPIDPVTRQPIATNLQEEALVRRHAAGLNPERDPNFIDRTIESVDQALNQDAPIEQLAREIGQGKQYGPNPSHTPESVIHSEMGQRINPRGQAASVDAFFRAGIDIEGNQTTPGDVYFRMASQLDDVELDQFNNFRIAHNILEELDARRKTAANKEAAVIANPNSTTAAIQNAQRINRLWQQYDPSIRRYLPKTDEATLRQQADITKLSPRTMEVLSAYEKVRIDAVESMRSVLGNTVTNNRLKKKYHTTLWDPSDPNNKYDPSEPRTRGLEPWDPQKPFNRVHQILDPIAGDRLRIARQLSWASSEIGKRRIAHMLTSLDPSGKEIYLVTPTRPAVSNQGGTFSYTHDGITRTYQTARKSVADAINQSPYDGGMFINALNRVRQVQQASMVHLLAGPAQAPKSLFMDMLTGFFTQRRGTSVGYVSRWIRQAERRFAQGGYNPAWDYVADLVDAVSIPDRLLATAITGVQAGFLKATGAFGRKLMLDAASRSGFIGALARVPGMRQKLMDMGYNTTVYFNASWMGAFQRWNNVRTHEIYRGVQLTKRAIDAEYRQFAKGMSKSNPLMTTYTGYTAILDTVASLAQYTHAAQQFAIEKTGKQRPTLLAERLAMEQGRRVAGDMSGTPGSKILRGYGMISVFARIGMQSMRHVFHAFTTRDKRDTSLVAARFASAAGFMLFTNKMMEELGLSDWFYETLNDFERNGLIWVMKFQHWIEYMSGQEVTIDRQNPKNSFYQLPLTPEIGLPFMTMMYMMEQAGFINRGSNRGNTSADKDLIYSSIQALNIGTIPMVGPIFTLMTGSSIDISGGARGGQMLRSSGGNPAQMGELPSGIMSQNTATFFREMFGWNAQMIIQSLDAGMQSYEVDKDGVAAVKRAGEEATELFKEKTFISVPGLWDGRNKVSGFTQLSGEIKRQNQVADQLRGMYSNMFTSRGMQRGENRRQITDPEISSMLRDTHNLYERGPMKRMMDKLNRLNDEMSNIQAGKSRVGYHDVEKEKDRIALEMRPIHDEMASRIIEYQNELKEKYGPIFEREKLEPKVDSVVKLVRKYSQ